ncbi:MAG: CAP domain-containing protein [Proteobacteria bacterium]|nr:CAP domain-containing protein [Pseudomonadota bacterium]
MLKIKFYIKVILSIVFALLFVVGVYSYVYHKNLVEKSSVVSTPIVQDCSVTDDGVIEAVNKYRAEVGVAPLVFNQSIDDFSNKRATDLNGVLDNHAGLQPALDSTRMGLYILVGEDLQLSTGCHNSDNRVLNFKKSEKHWKSLLNPRYDEIGVGFYKELLVINLGDVQ